MNESDFDYDKVLQMLRKASASAEGWIEKIENHCVVVRGALGVILSGRMSTLESIELKEKMDETQKLLEKSLYCMSSFEGGMEGVVIGLEKNAKSRAELIEDMRKRWSVGKQDSGEDFDEPFVGMQESMKNIEADIEKILHRWEQYKLRCCTNQDAGCASLSVRKELKGEIIREFVKVFRRMRLLEERLENGGIDVQKGRFL